MGSSGSPFFVPVNLNSLFAGLAKDKNKKDNNGKYNHIAIPDAGGH